MSMSRSFRAVAMLAFLLALAPACVGDGVSPPAPEGVGGDVVPHMDGDPVASLADADEVPALTAALRAEIESELAPSLGRPLWAAATLQLIHDDEVLVVPMLAEQTSRALLARLDRSGDVPGFDVVVIELSSTPGTDDLAGGVSVLDLHGATRLVAEGEDGGCFRRCMEPVGNACLNACGGLPQCVAACNLSMAAVCAAYCLWPF